MKEAPHVFSSHPFDGQECGFRRIRLSRALVQLRAAEKPNAAVLASAPSGSASLRPLTICPHETQTPPSIEGMCFSARTRAEIQLPNATKFFRHHFSNLLADAVSPELLLLWRRASILCKAPLKKSAFSFLSATIRFNCVACCRSSRSQEFAGGRSRKSTACGM